MERNSRQAALQQLLSIASEQGYIVFDDIIRCAEENALSIGDFDWLSNAVSMRNILVYDEAPDNTRQEDDYEDFAHDDYELVFNEISKHCPDMDPLIEEIRRIVPPQRGEVRRLMCQVAEGNQYARQRMIEMYLRLAVKIALQRATVFSIDLSETIGNAVVGLIYAVDKYDVYSNGPFTSFASFWIYQNITREQPTQIPDLYYPVHRKEAYYAVYPIMKKRGCLFCDDVLECDKVLDMICYQTNCNRKAALEIVTACLPCVSWEEFAEEYADDESMSYSDMMMIETVSKHLEADQLRQILNGFPERQRQVIIQRNGLEDGVERTLEEIGVMLGVTRERVRQIELKAMRRLQFLYRKAR